MPFTNQVMASESYTPGFHMILTCSLILNVTITQTLNQTLIQGVVLGNT